MKKFISIAMAVLVLCMCVGTPVKAMVTSPYGFVWFDDNTHIWHIQYFEYDSTSGSMTISDRVSLKGTSLYDMAGAIICDDVKDFTNEKPTVAINGSGVYFISKSDEVRYMENSTDQTFSVANYTAEYFETDYDDLALNAHCEDKVYELKGSSSTTGAFNEDSTRKNDPIKTHTAYVVMYGVNSDPEKVAYEAIVNGKATLTTYCKKANVWQQNAKLLLTNINRGAKFCGYTRQFNILVNDMYGRVLEYRYDEGFAKEHVILENVQVYCFEQGENGFLKTIIYDKGTHELSQELKLPTAPITPVANIK